MKLPVFCIMGPTAIGKTDIALKLAHHLPVQLISVDSAMVYRGMDIGTGKPTPQQQKETPHALIDCCDPSESYSAGKFCKDAAYLIEQALREGRWPCLVGGTMLYYRALLQGLADLPSADPAVRAEIEARGNAQGWPTLHKELHHIDPRTAATIHPHDAQRIQRALEIWQVSGRTRSDWSRELPEIPYTVKAVAIWPQDREVLYARIALRFQRMLDAGFVKEVRQLYDRGDLHVGLPSIRAVGYQQLWAYLAGQLDFETSCARAVIATRHLAKRQLTWLRTWPDLIKVTDQDPNLFPTLLMHCRETFADF